MGTQNMNSADHNTGLFVPSAPVVMPGTALTHTCLDKPASCPSIEHVASTPVHILILILRTHGVCLCTAVLVIEVCTLPAQTPQHTLLRQHEGKCQQHC